MKKLVVFGVGKVAHVVSACLERDSSLEIAAYTCDAEYVPAPSFRGKPVVPFERIDEFAPPGHEMLVAIGYQELNRLRERKLAEAKAKGYPLFSYVAERATGEFQFGENCFVCPGAHVEPGVQLGDNVFVWDGALIGHHSVVGDNCWIAGGAGVGGASRIGRNCFVGLNSTIGHQTTVGDYCLIGAAVLVTKHLSDRSVVIRRDTDVHRLNSDEFLRFTRSL